MLLQLVCGRFLPLSNDILKKACALIRFTAMSVPIDKKKAWLEKQVLLHNEAKVIDILRHATLVTHHITRILPKLF